jgi:hypothetical protein
MKDRKEQTELAQQLLNTCVKIAVSLLALAAAVLAV